MKQGRRDFIASEFFKLINSHPESISNFICCVVDECCMSDLERIMHYYKNSLNKIYERTKNLDN